MTGNHTPLAFVWLRGKFHAELCQEDGTQQAIANAEWAGSYARVLLKYLLSAPGRRATRSDLIDDLWPGDGENVDQYLYVASSKLRKIFHTKEIIKRMPGGYELAGPAVLWTDIEECEQLMLEAERLIIETEHRDLSSAHALFLLERVSRHFQRGGMLEGEAGEWCTLFRTQQDKVTRYCHLMLAKSYESQDMILLAQKQYQRLFDINPIDEDALRRLLGMLQRQGMLDDLRSSYEEAQKRFEKYEMSLSEITTHLFEHLMQESIPFSLYTSPPRESPRSLEREVLWQPDTSLAPVWPVSYNRGSQSSSQSFLEKPRLLMIPRRTFLHDILNFASSSLVLSPNVLLPEEGREQLKQAMTNSSYLDKEAIGHLAATTQNYWSLRGNCASIDLLDGIVGHFLTITRFLKDSRPIPIYNQLGALASETAQLLGRTFHEMGEFDLAWDAYAFALKMAQEIDHKDLWASGAVRLADLIMKWGDPLDALPFLHEAQRKGISDQRLRIWLSVVETQIYARTGNMAKFLITLEQSKKITLPESLAYDPYRTNMDALSVVRYEGSGLMYLRKPEQALPVLNQGFTTHGPISMLGRSNRLAEIGTVHAQLGDVKKACKQLLDSLNIMEQTKSLVTLQRIYKGRAELDRWKDSGDVKDLDARIVEVYKSFTKVKEQV